MPAVVALNGYGRIEDREVTRAAGFSGRLMKPIGFDTLQEVIAAQVRNRGPD